LLFWWNEAMRRKWRSFGRHASGGAAIEFALIGPAVVILLIGVTDFGLGFYRRMQVQSAAQRGAIYATVNGPDINGITTAITSSPGSILVPRPGPITFDACATSSGLTSTCPTGVTPGTYVSAPAVTSYRLIFRYPGLTSPMTFSATQVVRVR
jgi:Flp pilus assembly pilin Flp